MNTEASINLADDERLIHLIVKAGFDNDPTSIFKKLTNFIQGSGIVTAMVGLLNVPKGTKLEKRLEAEGRMLKDFTGNNTDSSINFFPRIDAKMLLESYRKILNKIYSPKHYYECAMLFMKDYEPNTKKIFHFNTDYIIALFRSRFKPGIIGEENNK